MKRGSRIYVAGPYTGGDIAVNVASAMRAGNRLLDAGLFPFIPHLAHFWHIVHPRPYADWLALDLAWLPLCVAILRLPGASPGADHEVAVAESQGIPVYMDIETLLHEVEL